MAQASGVLDEPRFRDQIALLEVDIVALEVMVLRVLCAEERNREALDVAGLLKITGSEIEQRFTELALLAVGPGALASSAGWVATTGAVHAMERPAIDPRAFRYFNSRKSTIYGGSNEVQRNIVAQSILG